MRREDIESFLGVERGDPFYVTVLLYETLGLREWMVVLFVPGMPGAAAAVFAEVAGDDRAHLEMVARSAREAVERVAVESGIVAWRDVLVCARVPVLGSLS